MSTNGGIPLSPSFRQGVILTAVLLLSFPATVSANMGTPLLWGTIIYLAIGNAFIAIIEARLLTRFFGVPSGAAILAMLFANYLSAWVGLLILRFLTGWLDLHIANIGWWFWGTMFLMYLFGTLIEFPMVAMLFRKIRLPLRNAVKPALMVNGVTYVMIFGLFWVASGTSMMTRLRVVDASRMDPPEEYELYYLSADRSRILRSGLSGEEAETVREVDPAGADRLFARPNREGAWDLHLLRYDGETRGTEELIKRNFAAEASMERETAGGTDFRLRRTWTNFGRVSAVGDTGNRQFYTGFWALEGISEREGRSFSMETVMAQWPVRNATYLRGDFLLFQLGTDQICLMQPDKRRIALIARGAGPVVALSKTTVPEPPFIEPGTWVWPGSGYRQIVLLRSRSDRSLSCDAVDRFTTFEDGEGRLSGTLDDLDSLLRRDGRKDLVTVSLYEEMKFPEDDPDGSDWLAIVSSRLQEIGYQRAVILRFSDYRTAVTCLLDTGRPGTPQDSVGSFPMKD